MKDSVLSVAVHRALAQWPCIVGVWLAGSWRGSGVESEADIDLHAAVEQAQSASPIAERRTRYGWRVEVGSAETLDRITVATKNHLVEWTLIPMSAMGDQSALLATHEPFAASTTLYYGDIVYDPTGALHTLQKHIRDQFCRRSWIDARLSYVRRGVQDRLDDYGKHSVTESLSLCDLWDGPLWSLMQVGNLVLTGSCRRLTFRHHLVAVKEVCDRTGNVGVYEDLVRTWGFGGVNGKLARWSHMAVSQLYDEAMRISGGIKRSVHPWTKAYWLDGIRLLLDGGMYVEAMFPIIMCACNCARVLRETSAEEATQVLEATRGMFYECGWMSGKDCRACIGEIMGLMERTSRASVGLWECDDKERCESGL